MPVSEEMVERAYNRFIQANSETVDCPRCKAKGYHHGFGEHGHDPDWCENCGGPGFVPKFDEMSAMREALTAALSDHVVVPRDTVTGIVRRVGWMHNKDVDPGNDDAEKFLGVIVEYPNNPPDFSPSVVWARTPVRIVVESLPVTPPQPSEDNGPDTNGGER